MRVMREYCSSSEMAQRGKILVGMLSGERILETVRYTRSNAHLAS